jgi:hypothetical protein
MRGSKGGLRGALLVRRQNACTLSANYCNDHVKLGARRRRVWTLSLYSQSCCACIRNRSGRGRTSAAHRSEGSESGHSGRILLIAAKYRNQSQECATTMPSILSFMASARALACANVVPPNKSNAMLAVAKLDTVWNSSIAIVGLPSAAWAATKRQPPRSTALSAIYTSPLGDCLFPSLRLIVQSQP